MDFALAHAELVSLQRLAFRNGRWRHVSADVSPWWAGWLGGEAVKFWNEIHPTRDMLAELRLRARRCRAWFNELSEDQRNFIELVIAVVREKVHSLFLAKLLAPIVKRLLEAIGGIQALIGEVAYKMRTDGLRLAQKLSQIAQAWGNKSAAKWPEDKGFIQYLTIMDMHKPLGA